MALSKVFSTSGNLLRRQVLSANNAVAKANIHYAPPEVRMGFAQKAMWGALFGVLVSAYPLWVLYHVPDYQGTPRRK